LGRDGDVNDLVSAALAPYNEDPPEAEYDEEGNCTNGAKHADNFWDWWQIGGRWTGTLSGYDPEKDPCNADPFMRFGGVKWPTQWARHDGDVIPGEQLSERAEFIAQRFAYLVDASGVIMHERYDSTKECPACFVPHPDWPGAVREFLDRNRDLRVVVVDVHS
jgi:hypothetical protein